MNNARQYAVLGPMESGSETRAFLGCEVVAGIPRPDLPVVIVWLPVEVAQDPKRVARLQRETVFVTELDHPHIIRVHGLERFDEGWARVVAFADGESLTRVIDRARTEGIEVEPRYVARIILDAAEAVHYAHEAGRMQDGARPIVHGGIRPDTLLVTLTGHTLVTGYGASVLAPNSSGTSAKTHSMYLAPEQIIGGLGSASTTTDVYALGAVLYELLSGQPPFFDDEDVERAVLSGELPRLKGDSLSARLAKVAVTAMAKRGADRFPSVESMADGIKDALAAEGIASASHEELSELIAKFIPHESDERTSRVALLDSAHDPSTVTVLSRPGEVEPAQEDLSEDIAALKRKAVDTGLPAPESFPRISQSPVPDTLVEGLLGEGTWAAKVSKAQASSSAQSGLPKFPPPSPASEAAAAGLMGGAGLASGADSESEGAGSSPLNPASFVGVSPLAGLKGEQLVRTSFPVGPLGAPRAPGSGPPPPPPADAPSEISDSQASLEQTTSAESSETALPVQDGSSAEIEKVVSSVLASVQAESSALADPRVPPSSEPFVPSAFTSSVSAEKSAMSSERVPSVPSVPSVPVVPTGDLGVPSPAGPPLTSPSSVSTSSMWASRGTGAPNPSASAPSLAPGMMSSPGPSTSVPGVPPGPGAVSSVPGLHGSHPGFAMGHAGLPGTSYPPYGSAPPSGPLPYVPGSSASHPGFVPPGVHPSAYGFPGGPGMGMPMPPPGYPGEPSQDIPSSVGPHPFGHAGLQTRNPPGRGGAQDLLEGEARPGRGSREISVITAFHRLAGDGSRSVILLVVVAAVALLAFLFAFPKEPPEGLDAPSERSRLPPELVKAAFEKKAIPTEPESSPDGVEVAEAGDVPQNPAASTAAVEPGQLSLTSEPTLSVFDGTKLLGRTPLTANLEPGVHRLRFTDRRTGVNFYKSYRIRPGAARRDQIELGKGTLVVHAPTGAVVLLNARRLGEAPMEPVTIYEGEYLLRVSYEGMRWAERFEASPGQTIEYTITERK